MIKAIPINLLVFNETTAEKCCGDKIKSELYIGGRVQEYIAITSNKNCELRGYTCTE